MKTIKQHYFSKVDIEINNITRIDLPIYSIDGKKLISRPVLCIFYPDGKLFNLISMSLFKIRKKRALPILSNAETSGFYCELRQIV